MIFVYLLSILTMVSPQCQQESLCSRMSSAYESMCSGVLTPSLASSQGPTGKQGAVGAKGEKGAEGSAAEIDYDRVDAEIARRVREASQGQAQKFSELSNALLEAEQKIQEMGNKTESCPLKYRGKCYWFEMDERRRVNSQNIYEICASQGGKPANIYSEFHHYMLLEYLRLTTWSTPYSEAWLGMTYSHDTKTVYLSDGTAAPYVKWSSGFPSKNTAYDRIFLRAEQTRGASNHMRNWEPTTGLYGLLCEN